MNRPDPATDGTTPIEQDIADQLTDGLQGETPDADLTARVKHRLLRRIAEDQTPTHHTVQPGHDGWLPFGRGLKMKVLHEADGIMSYLVRMAPGSSLPPHRHPVDEECVVLEGSLHIGDDLVVPAGGFHLGRRDVLHACVGTEGGGVFFVRGATPVADLLL